MADVHDAVQDGDLEGVERAIAADSSALNIIGPGGQSPLMHAVLGGKTEIVKFLLEKGADTSIAEKDGYTPMHGAGNTLDTPQIQLTVGCRVPGPRRDRQAPDRSRARSV